jgi:SsrA-binding protein
MPKSIAPYVLGVGQGRNKTDKRHAIADRDWQRDKAGLLKGDRRDG